MGLTPSERQTSGFVNRRSAIWPRSAPAVQRRRLKYRTLGRWWWRWCSAARPRDRSLWQRWLLRSLDPASPDTVLLTADRTNVAARARLPFLRMRNHAKSRNDDPDDWQAYDRHSSPPCVITRADGGSLAAPGIRTNARVRSAAKVSYRSDSVRHTAPAAPTTGSRSRTRRRR